MPEAPPLDLDVPRGPGALFKTTLSLFAHHSGLFLSLTLLVVAPVVILVDGVWGRGLVDGAHADVPVAAAAVAGALQFLMPVLVTALHVVVVRDLADGRVSTVGEGLRSAAPRFPHAIAAVLVYTVLTIGGAIFLIIPGIWVFVAGYFVAQTAVIEGRGPLDAFRRSSELVEGRWWRTAGTLTLGLVAFGAVFFALTLAVAFVDYGVAYVALLAVVQALEQSLTALFGTLMYFSLRARKEHPSPSVSAAA